MTRRELEASIALRGLTTRELKLAERLHAGGRCSSYITGYLKVDRDFYKPKRTRT